MKNKTKSLSKLALLAITVGVGATLASAHVSAHADSWKDTIKRDAKLIKNKSTKEYKKISKQAKKEIKKYERKNVKSKKLFHIRVKANKAYTYLNSELHKEGRQIEKKGVTLWVSGVIKKGNKTFYKLVKGKLIPASKHFVDKLSK